MKLKIETYERDDRAKTGRWKSYRHKDGSKNVAEFNTIGRARRFATRHCLAGVYGRARIVNMETGEITEL